MSSTAYGVIVVLLFVSFYLPSKAKSIGCVGNEDILSLTGHYNHSLFDSFQNVGLQLKYGFIRKFEYGGLLNLDYKKDDLLTLQAGSYARFSPKESFLANPYFASFAQIDVFGGFYNGILNYDYPQSDYKSLVAGVNLKIGIYLLLSQYLVVEPSIKGAIYYQRFTEKPDYYFNYPDVVTSFGIFFQLNLGFRDFSCSERL